MITDSLESSPSRIRNRRILGALILGILLDLRAQDLASLENTTVAALRDRPDSPAHRVSFRGGLLGIQARHAPWGQLLKEIGHETGIVFHFSVPLQGLVTLSFADLPVKQALERLFGPDANFIVRDRDATTSPDVPPVPAEVWVIGEVQTGCSEAIRSPREKPETGPIISVGSASAEASKTEAGQTIEAQEEGSELTGPADHTQGQAQDASKLIELAGDQDPNVRLQALSALTDSGKIDEDTVRSALNSALTDKDAKVRAYAVEALARRAGPDAADATAHLRVALHDPDPTVRAVAVDIVEPSTHGGLALLREALSDPDETVRSMADFKLKQGASAARAME
jgi:hypothetical protein